ARSLRNDISVSRLTWDEIANHIETLRRSAKIRIGKLGPVRDFEIRPRDFNDDHANLLLPRSNFRGREVARRDIVVIPEAEIDNLAPREQFPYLRRKDAEVCSSVGRGFRTRMSREDMQHASAEFAVLVLLAPYTRGQVH